MISPREGYYQPSNFSDSEMRHKGSNCLYKKYGSKTREIRIALFKNYTQRTSVVSIHYLRFDQAVSHAD